ncbi:MAG: DUF4982 domain-containing protein [Bacteroidales bacterium]|nr:DUF4982 domain-containing protein [Bacteroidales bacterium]
MTKRRNLRYWMLALSCSVMLISCKNTDNIETRSVVSFNGNWKFIKDTTDENFSKNDMNDATWEDIVIPHTPKIEPLVVNDQWQGDAWYRKTFRPDEKYKGKKIFLRFQGAMQVADIWLNGIYKMQHRGGYLPFTLDITNDINWNNDNVIAIKLNNEDNPLVPPGKTLATLDFNMYGGIYRNVEMIVTDYLYITDPVLSNKVGSGGIFLHFDSVSSELAIAKIKTHIQNDSDKDVKASVSHIFYDASGKAVAYIESIEKNVKAGEDVEIDHEFQLASPMLWSPEKPYLYSLKTFLRMDDKVIDEMETKTGIRNIKLLANGFYVNGKKSFIRGTNRHQEYPYVGYAISDEAQYRDAVKIKNAGFDFVRLSHYPQSEAFLDACDELGIMVMNCIPGWQFMGNDTFRQESFQNCRDMIRRDRNHPSIIFWEVSINETPMDEVFITKMNRILDEELSGSAISCGWIDHPSYDLFIPARQHSRPPVYWSNYKNGERPVFIAEYGDWEYYAQNAGFNQTAYTDLKEEERTSRQLRVYGEKRLLQQATNYQEATNSNFKGKSTIGHANWLMFDYNRGYADDIESSGISDIFRIPKFSYFFFQSQRPANELLSARLQSGPMVYIASFWQAGSSTDVRIFSNCEEVELFLNGKTLGKQIPDTDYMTSNLPYPPFTFHIGQFQAGELKALGYIENVEKARSKVTTPDNPSAIKLRYDLSGKNISKTGLDYIFVYAEINDNKGNLCPINGYMITFKCEGKCIIIGPTIVDAEAGIATILLQTSPDKKDIMITASGEGLTGSEILIPR